MCGMSRTKSRSWKPYITLTMRGLFKAHRPNLCWYANWSPIHSCRPLYFLFCWSGEVEIGFSYCVRVCFDQSY